MGWKNIFTRRKYRPTTAQIYFVPGDVPSAGPQQFVPLPTHANPEDPLRPFPYYAFTPLRAYGYTPLNQGLALPSQPQYGIPFSGATASGLIDPDDYPNLYPGLQDGE